MPAAPPIAPQLHAHDLRKRFGGVHALDGAELLIERPGTIHGLIGANGSGKSTLLGVLSGQLRPDAGGVRVDGRPLGLGSTVEALDRGIAMVSQETALAPGLSVAENVLLGGRQVRRGVRGIDWPATRRRAAAVLDRLGLDVDPATPVGTLRPDQQQLVEIARALSLDARVLVLDEATSSLTDDEVRALFAAVRRLRDDGVSTIFVSHRLEELLELCDELTVLRDGRTVAGGPIADFDAARIVTAMVGERPRPAPRASGPPAADRGAPVLRARGLATAGIVADVDLDVRAGEIVGLAGIIGAGRSELLEALFGARPLTAGRLELHGRPFAPRTPRHAIDAGIGLLPPDRKLRGLVLSASVADNLAVVRTRDRHRLRAPGGADVRRLVAETSERMHVRAASPQVAASTLSGGNQQKVALGKWVAAESSLLLLDGPTRGVDVAAKAEIHRLLRERAAAGTAIVVSSPEDDELLALTDRILVLFRGRPIAFAATADLDPPTLAALAAGHGDALPSVPDPRSPR